MRDRDRDIFHAQPFSDLACYTLESQRRFAARFTAHFDVAPAHSTAPAGAKRLHRRFFRGEPAGVAFEFIFVLLAISHFTRRVQSLEECRAAPGDGRLDTIHFGDIESESDDHRSPR